MIKTHSYRYSAVCRIRGLVLALFEFEVWYTSVNPVLLRVHGALHVRFSTLPCFAANFWYHGLPHACLSLCCQFIIASTAQY